MANPPGLGSLAIGHFPRPCLIRLVPFSPRQGREPWPRRMYEGRIPSVANQASVYRPTDSIDPPTVSIAAGCRGWLQSPNLVRVAKFLTKVQGRRCSSNHTILKPFSFGLLSVVEARPDDGSVVTFVGLVTGLTSALRDGTPQTHLHQFLHVFERFVHNRIEFTATHSREGFEPCPGEPFWYVFDWNRLSVDSHSVFWWAS